MLRRPSLLPLVLVAVVLIGCGGRQDSAARVDSSPEPSRHSLSTASASPTPVALTGPLADFPLALGYPRENGDDHSAVEITSKPASRRFRVCHRTVWDPRQGVGDLIGVEYRGEAEDVRGRTLVLYGDADAATAAVAAARTAIAACVDEPTRKGQGIRHTVLDEDLGGDSLVWTDTYYAVHDGEQLHDTGLVVYTLTRVGRTVLLTYEYGEGNGTVPIRRASVAHALRQASALITRMEDRM
jgi:hypothetical protein